MIIRFLLDVWRLAFKALTERRFRAALTIAGIAIGPLALVMISSVVDGYGEYVVSQIEGFGQNAVVLFPESGYRLSEKDLNAIRSIQGVKRAEPFYSTQAQVRVGGETRFVLVYAIPIDLVFETIRGLELLHGSIPSDSEYLKAVVGYRLAHDSSGNVVYRVGDVVTLTYLRQAAGRTEIKRVSLVVNGVLSEFGGAFFMSPDVTIFVPLQAGERIFGLKDWSGIFILVERSEYVPLVVSRLREMYRGSASIVSFQSIAEAANSIVGAVNLISFSASLSAFAVAVAGIAATMMTSVVERTREIGVLKALGFTDFNVLLMVLSESLIMGLIGSAIGIVLGIIGSHALASVGLTIRAGEQVAVVVRVPPKITLEGITRALALTIGVSIAGGAFPAYRASRIPPATALRYE